MGLGSVLSQQEMLCIMRHYLDPNDSQHVCWRTFEDDCDQGAAAYVIQSFHAFIYLY